MCDNEIEKSERNYKRFLSDTDEYCKDEIKSVERINKRLLSDAKVICNREIEMTKRLLTTDTNFDCNSARIRS